jgi:segregation and condensation protein B
MSDDPVPNAPALPDAADAAVAAALAQERQLADHIAQEAVAVSEPVPGPEPGTTAAPAAAADEEPGDAPPLDPQQLQRLLEALLFAAAEPVSVRELARATDTSSAVVRKALAALAETATREQRVWELAEVAGAYRLVTRPEFHPAIQRLRTQSSQRKLTQAALETLALIAYKQPLGRAEIESIRGVNAGPVLRVLLEKKLIEINGRGTGVGAPLLYATSTYFLEHFGLKSVAELPRPGELKNT